MKFPADLKYSKEHEWVRRDGRRVVVGITDLPSHSWGYRFCRVACGRSCGHGRQAVFCRGIGEGCVGYFCAAQRKSWLKSTKALNDAPEKLNQDPYGDGWIAVVEVAEGTNFDDLMDSEAYAAQVAKGGH